MGTRPDPIPDRAPIIADPRTRLISPDWYRWLFLIRSLVGSAAQQIGSTLSLSLQTGSIAPVGLPLPALSNATYRVSVYAHLTTAAATSSDLTVTVGWTDHGLALTHTTAHLAPTNVIQGLINETFPILVDQNTAITYSTTYSSVPAGQMQYSLIITVEII